MDKNIFIGQAMEDINAGEAVVIDAITGKLRKANRYDGEIKIEPIIPSVTQKASDFSIKMKLTHDQIKDIYGIDLK